MNAQAEMTVDARLLDSKFISTNELNKLHTSIVSFYICIYANAM